MPKSSSERYSKSKFSDSEFVFDGVKFNSGIDMGDGGRERDMGGDGDLGVNWGILGLLERGILGWWRWGSRGWWRLGYGGGDSDLGEMGMWVVEMGMWVVESAMWRVM